MARTTIHSEIFLHYAYGGFLYAPLFLARNLNLLPANFILKPAGTDEAAISKLCSLSTESEKNWFAVCDPFSVALDRRRAHLSGDTPRIIGSLINKPAFWAYHPAAVVQPVEKEEGLQQYRDQAIKSLICYSQGTTGYVFGKRLQQKIGLSDGSVIPISFEEEPVKRAALLNHQDALLLTSDALFLAKEAIQTNKPDIVLHYPVLRDVNNPTLPHPDLNPFLFTAIVTLQREVVERNLWAAITLLHALDQSIRLLSSDSLSPVIVDELVQIFTKEIDQLNVTEPEERNKLIRTATRFLFHSDHQRISPANLIPTKESAEKALTQWRLYGGTQVGDLKNLIDEGPSLLCQDKWRRLPQMHSYFWMYYPDAWRLLTSRNLPLPHRCALLITSFLGIVALPGLVYALCSANSDTKLPSPVFWAWGVTAATTYFIYLTVIVYCGLKLAKGALDYFFEILGWGVAVGIASTYSALHLLSSK